MRRVPIRLKLAATLAVPLLGLAFITLLEVVQSGGRVRDVNEQTELAAAADGPTGLVTALQEERDAAGVYLIDLLDAVELDVEDAGEARAATDAALIEFREELERKGGQVEATYAPALEQLEGLDEIRAKMDAFDGERGLNNTEFADEIFSGYAELVNGLFAATTRVAIAVDDYNLRRGSELIDLTTRQNDLLAHLVRADLLASLSGDGVTEPAEIAEISELLGQYDSNVEKIRTKATGDYQQAADVLFGAEHLVRFRKLVADSLQTGEADIEGMLGSATQGEENPGYGLFHTDVQRVLEGQADDLKAAANARQLWFVALALTALLAAGVVTWLVSRSITRPLRSLTRQAKTMADARLPDAVLDILETPLGEDVTMPHVPPVEVTTRDEVADVADALNTVQDSALDLAVEQAVLRRNIADSFVNLGRRNQNLLGRQLDFITELEAHETDPDTLANLFRLDHLATRMRRNAESLLVLAGIEPPRKWAAPVRLTDVIRAALGEVEDYQRVTVRAVEPATILGSVAADLAHLLAELIENALIFSPPDQTVEIRGRGRTDGYTLAIIDSGLGMAPDDVERANRRLAGAESFTIAPSKYLGHYVAGNLAARHNIAVQLDNSPGNGITATINLPPTLLTTDTPDTTIDVTPRSAGRATLTPPPQRAAIAPPAPALTPPPVHTRTASGLAKRAPRQPTPTTAAQIPDTDLLHTLANYTNQPTPPPTTSSPWAGLTFTPPTGTPTWPQPPPRDHATRPPNPSIWAELNLTPPPGIPAITTPRPPTPDTTPRGPLTRRIRGAQLPTPNPLALHRTGEHPTTPTRPGPNGDNTPPPPPPTSAQDVYGFLSSFTAGVQRGLDEARHTNDTAQPGDDDS